MAIPQRCCPLSLVRLYAARPPRQPITPHCTIITTPETRDPYPHSAPSDGIHPSLYGLRTVGVHACREVKSPMDGHLTGHTTAPFRPCARRHTQYASPSPPLAASRRRTPDDPMISQPHPIRSPGPWIPSAAACHRWFVYQCGGCHAHGLAWACGSTACPLQTAATPPRHTARPNASAWRYLPAACRCPEARCISGSKGGASRRRAAGRSAARLTGLPRAQSEGQSVRMPLPFALVVASAIKNSRLRSHRPSTQQPQLTSDARGGQ